VRDDYYDEGRHVRRESAPEWVWSLLQGQERLVSLIESLHRKVDILMALDANVIARILAGAASLVEQAQAAAARETALNATVADLQSQLTAAQAGTDQAVSDALAADDVADTAADAEANAQLLAAANALDALLTGPETPVVETPAPEDAPGVIAGDQPPTVVSEEPAANDSLPGTADTTV
jgi:hypothetical protein